MWLILGPTACCAFKEAFLNEGIPEQENIFVNKNRLEINLSYLREESREYFLFVAGRELKRLREIESKVLFCGHTKEEHENVLAQVLLIICWYRAKEKLSLEEEKNAEGRNA